MGPKQLYINQTTCQYTPPPHTILSSHPAHHNDRQIILTIISDNGDGGNHKAASKQSVLEKDEISQNRHYSETSATLGANICPIKYRAYLHSISSTANSWCYKISKKLTVIPNFILKALHI